MTTKLVPIAMLAVLPGLSAAACASRTGATSSPANATGGAAASAAAPRADGWAGLAALGQRDAQVSAAQRRRWEGLDRSIRARTSQAPGEVAVMLVDLSTDRALALNADVSMHAASTMKVPVLLEMFRQAAAGEYSLDEPVTVKNDFTSIADSSRFTLSPGDDSDSTLYAMVGRQTTLRELARRMTVRSSNLATDILIERVTADSVMRLIRALGTNDMQVLRGVEDIPAYNRGMNNTTTARALAGVFEAIARCERGDVAPPLRPLDAAGCRQITNILAEQEFNEKIPAGLPPGTRVAHKTGWITEIDHDAGIIYPPGRAPYILAVLTRGIADTLQSTAVARDVSRIVWKGLVR